MTIVGAKGQPGAERDNDRRRARRTACSASSATGVTIDGVVIRNGAPVEG